MPIPGKPRLDTEGSRVASAAESPEPLRQVLVWAAPLVVCYCLLGLTHFLWGSFTTDEGFYALASRNVSEGMKPYRDFAFQQMPLLPYVYAAWFRLCGASIETARALSLLFGAAALLLAIVTCHRRSGWHAGMICALLLGLNLSFVFDSVTFKTQPLTLILTSGSLFVLSRPAPQHSLFEAALAMALMSLAFLTRLSMLPALVCLWAYLLWDRRRQPAPQLGLVLANVVGLLITLYYFRSDGNLFFGVYQFHTDIRTPWTWGRLAEFLQGWLANQFPLILGLICGGVYYCSSLIRSGRQEPHPQGTAFLLYLLAAHGSTTLAHCANAKSYPTHQTSNVMFAAVFVSVILSGAVSRLEQRQKPWLLGGVALIVLFAMPFQQWDANFNGEGSIQRIQEAAGIVRRHARPGDTMLSFNSELVVNSGLKSLPGYDLAEFSYFPRMPDELAARLKVVNANKLLEDISQRRGTFLCAGRRDFSGMADGNPELVNRLNELIQSTYVQVGSVEKYGQYRDEMFILVLKR